MSGKKDEKKIPEEMLSDDLKRILELEENILALQKNLDEKDKQLKEKENQLLRATADVQNIRRRADEDRIKTRLDGELTVIKPVISLLDNFNRAFAHIPEDLKENEFIQSLELLEKNFSAELKTLGVEFFGVEGEGFDENKHESMILDPSGESGKVSQVFEKGVSYKGRTVRFAKVSVGQ